MHKIIVLILFLIPVLMMGQVIEKTDTIIKTNIETAKEFAEFQKYKSEAKSDLVPNVEEEGIITDRPHIAETPHLVPKHYFQWETGFQYQNTSSNFIKTTDLTYNTTLIRYGLSKRFELRFELDYYGRKIISKVDNTVIQNVNGLAGLTIGSKIFISQQKGLIPEATLLYHFYLPYPGTTLFTPSYTGSEIKFLLVNKLTKWYEFEYNIGVQWDGTIKNAIYAYAINNEIDLWKHKLFCFAELYGYFIENGNASDRFNGTFINDHRINGGFWYRVTPNSQFDISCSYGLSKVSPNYYVAIGFSNRFKVKMKNS